MTNKFVVIIPFALPWDWSADYERQTALTLAKYGHQVIVYLHENARFFLKPRPSQNDFIVEKNILFFQPQYPIPFRRFFLVENLNQFLNIFYLYLRYGYLKNKDVILWIFNPVFWFNSVMLRFLPRVKSLYDCVDYAWSPVANFVSKLQNDEKHLIRAVDYFFVNSQALAKLHQQIRVPDAVVPQGFALNDFQLPVRETMRLVHNKPIIGYVGSIVYRLDYFLLNSLVESNPQWNFVFCGFIQGNDDEKSLGTRRISELKKHPNVIIIKNIDRKYIPGIIKQFDIGIIPYNTEIPLNRYCYPMKLFEYFYLGKPVISTPVEELERFSQYVKIGKSAEDWENIIKRTLSKSWPNLYKEQQRRLAINNSWEIKIDTINVWLEK